MISAKRDALDKIIESFKVKKVEVLYKKQSDKFIQSEAREYVLNNGKKVVREQIIKGGKDGSAVIVIPVTNGEILTVIEPRVFTSLTVGMGFPSGYVEDFEEPLEAAKRELREETGLSSNNFIEIDSFYQDEGCSAALNTIYLALDCKKEYDQQLDKDEYVECMTFSYDELCECEELGYICGGNTKLALAKIRKYFKER